MISTSLYSVQYIIIQKQSIPSVLDSENNFLNGNRHDQKQYKVDIQLEKSGTVLTIPTANSYTEWYAF